MAAARLRIGLLGLDHWYWASSLIPEIRKNPSLELSALYEPLAWRRRAFGDPASRTAGNPREITDDPDIDLVISLLPAPVNAVWLARAAANGKALMCNKPLAMSVAAARPLVRALARTRRPSFGLEGVWMLSPVHRLVRRLLADGAVGRPLTVHSGLRGGMPQAWWNRGKGSGPAAWGWWTDPARVPGGAWIDHAIYAIPQVRDWLRDEPRRVTATMANVRRPRSVLPLEDYGVATYAYRKGAIVTYEYDWIGGLGASHVIAGTRGSLRWGVGVEPRRVEWRSRRGARLLKPPAGRAVSALEHVVACCRNRKRTVHDAAASLACLNIALAAYRAARSGRAVAL